MSVDVAVADYGIGNLFSVRRAFENCGASVLVTDDAKALMDAPRLVLPGVGAFANGMQGLQARGLDQTLVEYADSGRPLLGICLGMQLLASVSEEFGEHAGLSIVPGRVRAIPATINGERNKIPQIGWFDLLPPGGDAAWRDTILEDVRTNDAVYLVHSFMVEPADDSDRLANCSYNGLKVCSALRRGRVYGTQFHPEKSGSVGLSILRRFLAI